MGNKVFTIIIFILELILMGVLIYFSCIGKIFIVHLVLDILAIIFYIVLIIKELKEEKRNKKELQDLYASVGAIKIKKEDGEDEE